MLISVREASKELGVSEEHIRRQIKAGRWPYYVLGPKALRVDCDEIKRLGKFVAEIRQEREKA